MLHFAAQVGAAGLRSGLAANIGGKPLSMDQILGVLVSRARVEAEESQRQLVGALNGLAALLRLSGPQHAPDAVAAYREVLALAEAERGEVRLDPLQHLHTLHNLADLLGELARQRSTAAGATAAGAAQPYGPRVPRTLRDDSLASEAAGIRDAYLAQRQAQLAAAHSAYCKAAKHALPAGRIHGSSKGRGAAAAAAAGPSSSSRRFQEAMSLDDVVMLGDGGSSEDDDGEAAADGDGDGGAGAGGSGWYVALIDALIATGRDEEVAALIKDRLQQDETYLLVSCS